MQQTSCFDSIGQELTLGGGGGVALKQNSASGKVGWVGWGNRWARKVKEVVWGKWVEGGCVLEVRSSVTRCWNKK